MDSIDALLLGIVQGLTEYLPVSSSGHLVLGSHTLGIDDQDGNLTFAVVVHAATALSSIVIFYKEIGSIIKDLLAFKWNQGTKYTAMLALSAVPVVIVGLFFEDDLEGLFGDSLSFIGYMWLVTGVLLLITMYVKKHTKPLGFGNTFIMGLAQAVAVFPGISRSGATIAAGLLQKMNKDEIARFSFLMVIVPILGKDPEDALQVAASTTDAMPLLVGFIAAFVVGILACKAMISIVKRNKLYYFSIYCFVLGIVAILIGNEVI
ncbi:UNVERIFIED_CONTAM: hypothetical protein GTU68_057496 [Idotea baltica]|nr:hypothetical protein [Idotea baltica]